MLITVIKILMKVVINAGNNDINKWTSRWCHNYNTPCDDFWTVFKRTEITMIQILYVEKKNQWRMFVFRSSISFSAWEVLNVSLKFPEGRISVESLLLETAFLHRSFIIHSYGVLFATFFVCSSVCLLLVIWFFPFYLILCIHYFLSLPVFIYLTINLLVVLFSYSYTGLYLS